MKMWCYLTTIVCVIWLPGAVLAEQRIPLRSESGSVLWNTLILRELPVKLVVSPLLSDERQAIVEFSSAELEKCVKHEVLSHNIEISLKDECVGKNRNISLIKGVGSNNRVIVNGDDMSKSDRFFSEDSTMTVYLPEGVTIVLEGAVDFSTLKGFDRLSVKGSLLGIVSIAELRELELKLDGAGEVYVAGGKDIQLELSGAGNCYIRGNTIESLKLKLDGAMQCEVHPHLGNLDLQMFGVSSTIFKKVLGHIRKIDLSGSAHADFCFGYPVSDDIQLSGAARLGKVCVGN